MTTVDRRLMRDLEEIQATLEDLEQNLDYSLNPQWMKFKGMEIEAKRKIYRDISDCGGLSEQDKMNVLGELDYDDYSQP